MDLRISILLLAFFLLKRGLSQSLNFQSFEEGEEEVEPHEWDDTIPGCQTHFIKSRCIYEVFCRGKRYDTDEIYRNNKFDQDFCPVISAYNQHFGEVHVKLKQFSYLSYDSTSRPIFEDSDLFRIITTKLDLSDNKLSFFKLMSMEVLKTLNLSRNSFSEAFLCNSFELKSLQEIDYSHNTISSIIINRDNYVFKELKTIDLSYNYFVTLGQGIFDNFPKLENLDLSYNFIDALDILTFEGVKNLIILNLKHNRISNLDSSLVRFNKLETLDLSQNKIQSIESTDFGKLRNLEHLDLSSNSISQIDAHTFRELTALKTLNFRDNVLESVNKEMFEKLTKLQTVNLSKNNFKAFPKDVFKDKQISEFSITQNKLEGALVQGIFEGMGLVTEIDLSFQSITFVEDYAFYGVFNLKTLLLNDNSIQNLSNLSFQNLNHLETLDLSNNKLSNIDFAKNDLTHLESLFLKNNILLQVKSDLFAGINSLQFLDLSLNNISHLETNCFRSLKRLLKFEISDNPISGVLEENTFFGLISLPNLVVSGSLLTTVKNGSFNGMSQLKDLNLSHSKILELQYNAFLHTGMIEVIDLSNNELTDFNVNTTELRSLITLILKYNKLTAVSAEYFTDVPRLSKIILAHNLIETIDDGAFANQIDLRYLDLSFNIKLKFNVSQLENVRNLEGLYLSGIESNITFEFVHEMTLPYLAMSNSNISDIRYLAIQNLRDLDELVLSKNKIYKVEADNFKSVNKITKLDLSCNKITFIQPGAFKDNTLLQFLNISHNLLTSVNYGIFRGLSYLDTIDMSFNEIRDLQSERFYELKSLRILIADHNKISFVSKDEFYGTSLTTLSIGGNPIPCDVMANLKKPPLPFAITAVTLQETSENILGVTCNVDRATLNTKHDSEIFLPNERILLDIKDILHNMTTFKLPDTVPVIERSNDTHFFVDIGNKIDNGNDKITNVSHKIQEGNIILQKNFEETKNTNSLLDKLLKVLTAANKRIEPMPALQENVTADNLLPYINNVKKQLEDTIASEKQNIYTDFDEKIKKSILFDVQNKINDAIETKINKWNAQINSLKENAGHNIMSGTHEAYSANESSDTKSFIFLEVCVGLMLFVMVLFILYKFYNSGMFIPSRHSTSTRQLSDAIDNSNL